MRAGKRERWVRFVSVNLGTSGASSLVRDVSLKQIVNKIRIAFKRKKPLQRTPRATAKRHVRLVDVHSFSRGSKKYVVFLFRLIDRDAIDVTYEDFKDGILEPHPKKATQGNRATAHLVVRLAPQLKGSRKRYPAILEETAGLAAGRIEQVLDSLAKTYGRGSYKNSQGEEEQYTCRIEVKPKVVGTIRDELKKGILKSFTLVHSFKAKTVNDEKVHLEDKKKRLEVAIVGKGVSSKIDDLWKIVRDKANEGEYELVKANYENSDGRMTSADMEARRADALEDLVTKSKKLDLDADENYDQLKVSMPIVDKIVRAMEHP